ncbi:MAG: PAS domain-containing protein [Boseongicola sp.]
MSDSFDDCTSEHVIELTRYRGANVRPVLAQIEAYWDDVRGQRLVPSRVEIDTNGLKGALGHVFILERIAKCLARFRLAGSHLNELMGLDVRGMPLSATFQPAARASLSKAVQAVFDDPAVVRLELDAGNESGRNKVSGDMLLMPLRSDLGEVSRILGAVAMAGEIDRAPQRFDISGHSHRGLTGYASSGQELNRGNSEMDERGLQTIRPSNKMRTEIHRPENKAPSYLRLVADNTLVE